ncbi:mini zinc finger protein 3 [Phtheirospermum japonicum]|uniref:Mini zinc finger protein 3 n=1 Tax=Phtheirospermum japonicum TaxID=374723 RepID=A0A830C132_9LAMI|nr:mini zinc finger protein 3 [Phtheirospermum japonicum]
MEQRGECLKALAHMGGKVDGCQEFKAWPSDDGKCSICGCHVNYHKKVVPQARVTHVTEVVYTECHKNHHKTGYYAKDGCKEFRKKSDFLANICDACNCDKSFHRNELTKEVITYY